MLNMMKADMYRILKGKAIYIIFVFLILTSFVSAIGISPGHIGMSTSGSTTIDINDAEFVEQLSKAKSLKDVREIMKSGGAFELDKAVIGTNANLYYLFIVLVVIVLCTDFSNKSIKNTLSSAISRKKYYGSKTLLIFLLATFFTFFNTYFFYFLNIIINGKEFASSLLEVTKVTILELPLLYGIISLLICFAFLFKKTSTFNTVAIPFILGLQLVVIGITSLFKIKADWFYNYEFQFALEKIAQNPSTQYLIACTVLGIFYILIFHTIGYYSFKKSEIK
ncbi:MAG: hypothetical protein HFH08_00615 [Bacilli bacterium]|nr:hypothetical protein [Bacilli bacterium]